MVNRKFTESEVRAYTRNRHEEKVLRRRLEKLHDEHGIYHDMAAKQRTILLNENKDICMTSGESPIPNEEHVKNFAFDIGKRFTRPWAYSSMETTHNVKYKEAVIPLPKSKHKESRSRSEATIGYPGQDILSRKSSLGYFRAPTLQRTKSCLPRITFEPQVADTGDNEPSETETKVLELHVKHGNTLSIDNNHNTSNKRTLSDTNLNLLDGRYPMIVAQGSEAESSNNVHSTVDNKLKSPVDSSLDDNLRIRNDEVEELLNLEKKHDLMMPKVIILPRVYEIEMGSNKFLNQRRAASRVGFNIPINTNDTGDTSKHVYQTSTNNMENDYGKVHVGENNMTSKSAISASHKEQTNTDHNIANITASERRGESSDKSVRSKSAISEPANISETLEGRRTSVQSYSESGDVSLDKCNEVGPQGKSLGVFHKGKRLRNYIRPQERYKLDPVVVRRRQLKMDRLAKESMTYLSRVNHENIRVDIAFPRAVRSRILDQLVRENNSKRSQTPFNPESVLLKRKIEEFMDGVSRYISRQREEF